VAQVLGGLLGAYAAIQYIPAPWQSDFDALSSGVKPGVSLWAGVACEAILAFLLNVTILYSLGEHTTTPPPHSMA
jgi:glycerol uptake facilitator-like aquaporin